MLHKLLVVFMVACFMSCSTQSNLKGLAGKYQSPKYGLIAKIKMAIKKESYVLNSFLVLNEDSTYNLNTCGSIIKGNWKTKHDSLLLYCTYNYIKKDSIRKVRKPICGDKPSVFLMEHENTVLLKSYFFSNSKKIINNLERLED
jgi:hypothetical protein